MTTSSPNQQYLPGYSKYDYKETKPVSLPPSNASPGAVRGFIADLLIDRRGLSPDHAHRIAAHWTLGSGREVLSYSPGVYLNMFGHEHGWMLYKEIRILIWTNGQQERKKKAVKLYLSVLALLIWNVFMLHFFVPRDVGPSWTPGIWIASAFGLFVGFWSMCYAASRIYLDINHDPEEEAEAELRDATRRG